MYTSHLDMFFFTVFYGFFSSIFNNLTSLSLIFWHIDIDDHVLYYC